MTFKEYYAEYERLNEWRRRWAVLANKREPGRLQRRQEAIERRHGIANDRIGALMRAFDDERESSDG